MKTVGLILIALGFLGGAMTTVLHATEVNWLGFAPTFVVACMGVAFVRLADRQASTDESKLSNDLGAVRESLARIAEEVERLDAEQGSMSPYDVRLRIDERLPAELTRFVDARHSLAHVYGLSSYAEVMNPFAAAERYLNRVWSASADGYVDEVATYLKRSAEQFRVAQARVEELAGGDA